MSDQPSEKAALHKPGLLFRRGAIISASLIAVLIWGSSFLILAISHLQTSVTQARESNKLKSISDNLVRYSYDDYNDYTYKRLSFKDTRNSSFSPKFKSIQWVSDSDSLHNDIGLYATHDNDIYLIRSINDDNYEKLLYNGSKIHSYGISYSIDKFVSSPDLKYALIQTNFTQHWRHSSFGIYWILNVETEEIREISESKLSSAKWSPTSDRIAFVQENDIYVYDLSSEKTERVTSDGSASIFNGKPDWVYEEEVFEGDSTLWWSPNGAFLSFLRINDSLVPEFPIPYFVQDSEDPSYPELRKIKYPKPGYENPNVQLAVYDLSAASTTYIDYHDDIFTEVVWVGNEQLLLKSINREADFLKVVLVNTNDSHYEIVRDEVTDSWFEITHDTFFVPKSQSRKYDGYIDTISVNGYNHLAYFSPPNNSTPNILTHGDWEVVSAPSAFDYNKELVYYFSTKDSSIERHLYSVDLHTGRHEKYTEGEGWYSASFSSGSRFVSLNYRGPGVPTQKLLDLYTGDIKVLETNDDLKEVLDSFDLPVLKYGEIDIGTAKVNFVERLPPKFDPKNKYPVLFFVYGGPGSQLVSKAFELSFPEVVASQLNAVVVTVDGRGTGFKGREFRSLVRDNLGYYEVIDQISAAKHWASRDYVDSSNIAIFGWSYGGYMTLKTLEADAGETFSYGLSVAPVTDWRLYDSVYTERYMHQPKSNLEGYEKSSVNNVSRIAEAKRFLLCHGTGDDNVHFQNSLKFLDKLDLASIENYDVHVFPDSDHSIRYHNANVIIYDKLLLWLRKAFRGDYVLNY